MDNEYISYTQIGGDTVKVKYQVDNGLLSWEMRGTSKQIHTKKPLWVMSHEELTDLSYKTKGVVSVDSLVSILRMMQGTAPLQIAKMSVRTVWYDPDSAVVLGGILDWLYAKIGAIMMQLTFQTPPNIQRGTKFTIFFYRGKGQYFKELILPSTNRKVIRECKKRILDGTYDWLSAQ